MLSRDAGYCFWIGRYIERAEAAARMIDVHYHFALENPLMSETVRWSSILEISGSAPLFATLDIVNEEREILEFFIFSDRNPNAIVNCIRSARENARSIHEQISSEMWESLNTTWLELRNWNVDRVLEVSPHEFFQRVKNASHLFQGIMNRTLMMGESRDFLDAGRFLERADQTTRILDVKYHDLLPRFAGELSGMPGVLEAEVPPETLSKLPMPDPVGIGGPVDVHGWIAVLKSVGAYEAFRKTFHVVSPANVTAFLLLSSKFPASVRHGIGRVEGCLKRIGGSGESQPQTSADREVGKLYSRLNYVTADEIIASGLHEFLGDVQSRIAEIGMAITSTYLTH